MKVKLVLCIAALMLVSSLAVGARADEESETYIRMEETEIIGVIEHPEVTYIIPKTRIVFKRIPLERTFDDKITGMFHLLDLEKEVSLRTRFQTVR
ncbi:MAG: hypothetical protein JSV26_11330 [bacterium]|nr:MAG: hypothetical protein JSV26_11330 [bacterium]